MTSFNNSLLLSDSAAAKVYGFLELSEFRNYRVHVENCVAETTSFEFPQHLYIVENYSRCESA